MSMETRERCGSPCSSRSDPSPHRVAKSLWFDATRCGLLGGMFHLNTQAIVGLVGLAVSFTLMYPTIVAKLSLSTASPYPKVDLRRRLYAATIDGLLVASIFALYWSSLSLAFVASGAAYVLFRDSIRGRSLGKFLFGLA